MTRFHPANDGLDFKQRTVLHILDVIKLIEAKQS